MLQTDTSRHNPLAAEASRSKVLVLSEAESLEGRKPFLLDRLTAQEREYVIRQCKPKLAKRHAMVFRRGEPQKGIYLILSGGVRVFYAAPSGREITRAYWFAGHFIGGPDVFAQNSEYVVGSCYKRQQPAAASQCNAARALCANAKFGTRSHRGHGVQGPLLRGHGADAGNPDGRGAHDAGAADACRNLRRQDPARCCHRRSDHPRGNLPHGRRDASMGHHGIKATAVGRPH